MATKRYDFGSLFTEEDRKSVAYQTERAILEYTEDMVRRMDDLGVSRSELARRIESSPAYVTKILRGSTNFTLESMVTIGLALDCTLRMHLQPEGARTQWFDVLDRVKERRVFDDPANMKKELGLYAACVGQKRMEEQNDTVALAS